MAAESGASGFDDRLARMEGTMRQLEMVQSNLKWGGGITLGVLAIVAGILIAVVVLALERSFTLTDLMTDIKADTTKVVTAMDYIREDMSEIKSDTNGLQQDLQAVAEAVGAKLEQKKADLSPQ
jgi:hypothetical protein